MSTCLDRLFSPVEILIVPRLIDILSIGKTGGERWSNTVGLLIVTGEFLEHPMIREHPIGTSRIMGKVHVLMCMEGPPGINDNSLR